MLRGIFLDLDGTLINSEKAFCNCFLDVLNLEYGASVSKDDYRKYELEQNAQLISYVRSTSSVLDSVTDSEIMSMVYDRYVNYFREIIQEDEAKDNFELLRELKKKGYILSLVTTCRRHYLDILNDEEKIYELFTCVIAREDVEHLKPSEEAYIKALKETLVDVKDSLAMEDSKRGIDAALQAHIPTIKVDNFTDIKYHDERVLEEESANKVLRKIIQTGDYK